MRAVITFYIWIGKASNHLVKVSTKIRGQIVGSPVANLPLVRFLASALAGGGTGVLCSLWINVTTDWTS
jgi:hypothetical protein